MPDYKALQAELYNLAALASAVDRARVEVESELTGAPSGKPARRLSAQFEDYLSRQGVVEAYLKWRDHLDWK